MSVLITGATNGLGYEFAINYLKTKSNLIIGCRDMDKAKVLFSEYTTEQVILFELDMSSKQSIENFLTNLVLHKITLKSVILNAGISGTRREIEFDNKVYNLCWVVNYVAQRYLIEKLTTLLTPKAGVIFISSVTHHEASKTLVRPEQFYAGSKLAIIKYAIDYANNHPDLNITVINPGFVNTGIWKKPKTCLEKVEKNVRDVLAFSSDEASKIYSYAVDIDPEAHFGMRNEQKIVYLTPYKHKSYFNIWLEQYGSDNMQIYHDVFGKLFSFIPNRYSINEQMSWKVMSSEYTYNI